MKNVEFQCEEFLFHVKVSLHMVNRSPEYIRTCKGQHTVDYKLLRRLQAPATALPLAAVVAHLLDSPTRIRERLGHHQHCRKQNLGNILNGG